MAAPIALTVNGRTHQVAADADTPLLYILRNDLALNGAKYGCGLGQCGACTVLADGLPVRSCQVELGAIGAREITTLEGIGTPDRLHKLQRAFIAEQAAQCGYCTSGMILEAKALLDRTQEPTEPEIREQLAQHLCRCGTHNRIVAAVQRAIREG